MNIVEALADPELFQPHFRSPTWATWKVFLAALFGLAMTEEQAAVYRHHTGRTELPKAPFGEAALICGRRGGKSRTLAVIATYLATVRDYSPYLAPGEKATIAVIAADRRQARSIFRYINGMITNTPLLKDLIESETADTLALTNNVNIEIHTASFRSSRGYTLAAALCDEAAYWRSDESANPDVEILNALRPGLSNIPGAMLLLASSPYAKRGALWQAFRQHWAKDGSRVLVWRGTSLEMNPALNPGIVEQAYEDDPAAAAAEYGAEFRSDLAAFLTREVVDSCTVPGRFELTRITGQQYKAFVDPSGGSADSMTLAIAHREHDIAVLDAIREVKPPFSPEQVVKDFVALMKTYDIRSVTGDRYAGEWPREQFRKYGVDYELSDKPKSDIYRDTLPLLNSGEVELLDNQRLIAQLCSLERRTARGGRDSIDHPSGGGGAHDDVSNSVCGALLMCGKPSYDSSMSWVGDPADIAAFMMGWRSY